MSAGTTTAPAIGKSAMNKALWRIIPLILTAYLFAYVYRVNVGFAAATMNADLGFSATVYGLGAGLFFLGYALFEIPSNLMLVRFGARRWIARIMIICGGPPVGGYDVRSDGGAILHPAIPAWCRRSRVLPWCHLLFLGLVPALPPQPRGQSLLHRRAARVGSDGGDVGLAIVA